MTKRVITKNIKKNFNKDDVEAGREYVKAYSEFIHEVDSLYEASKKEKKMEYTYFTEKLMLHAQTEDEVLYPAAILNCEYLKLKLANNSKL